LTVNRYPVVGAPAVTHPVPEVDSEMQSVLLG